jgi:hypothetical protein
LILETGPVGETGQPFDAFTGINDEQVDAAGAEAFDPGNDGIAIRCIVDRDRCTNLERQKFIRNPSMPVQEYSSYCSRRSRRAPF